MGITIKSAAVERDGAVLHCCMRGAGSPLLMIHGVICDGDFFCGAAELLAQRHTVITYDRRGYSRSTGTPVEEFWKTQAEDAAAVLRELAFGVPAVVVGCSAGAIIAMKLAELYPELVDCLILHEPPLLSLLPKDHPAFETADKINQFVAEGKFHRAINRFLLLIGEQDERAPEKRVEVAEREMRNMEYFIKYEFGDTFSAEEPPRVPKGVPVILGAGDAHRENYHYYLVHQLGEAMGYPVVHFPGVHNCAYDIPQDFAVMVEGIISCFTRSGQVSDR